MSEGTRPHRPHSSGVGSAPPHAKQPTRLPSYSERRRDPREIVPTAGTAFDRKASGPFTSVGSIAEPDPKNDVNSIDTPASQPSTPVHLHIHSPDRSAAWGTPTSSSRDSQDVQSEPLNLLGALNADDSEERESGSITAALPAKPQPHTQGESKSTGSLSADLFVRARPQEGIFSRSENPAPVGEARGGTESKAETQPPPVEIETKLTVNNRFDPPHNDTNPDLFARNFEGVHQERAQRLYRVAAQVAQEKEYGFTYLSDLVRIYDRVPARVRRHDARMLRTLEVYVGRKMSPADLSSRLDERVTRDRSRVMSFVAWVYAHGFGMMGAERLAQEKYGYSLVSGSVAEDKMAAFCMGIATIGLGGTFAAIVGEAAKAGQKYSTNFGIRDGKAVAFLQSSAGTVIDGLSFIGFSIGHPIVAAMFDNKAGPKLVSAVLSTVLAGVLKSEAPRLLGLQDERLLDFRDPAKDAENFQLLEHAGQPRWKALDGYLQDVSSGYAKTAGIPSAQAIARGLLHIMAAGICLAIAFASAFEENDKRKYDLSIGGAVAIGLLWGPLHRMARDLIAAIRESAVEADRAAHPRAQPQTPADVVEQQMRALDEQYAQRVHLADDGRDVVAIRVGGGVLATLVAPSERSS